MGFFKENSRTFYFVDTRYGEDCLSEDGCVDSCMQLNCFCMILCCITLLSWLL